MLPDFKLKQIEKIKSSKKEGLVFVHTPKCGGSFVNRILRDLNIPTLGHVQAPRSQRIIFTVIREPVGRFESLLNYRLSESTPRKDWPKHLAYVYNDLNISLNTIVEQMSDSQILGFDPFKTLKYYSKNVDVLIVIDELKDFLAVFGYEVDISHYDKRNVSQKNRGVLNAANRNRIARLFKRDVKLYEQWTSNYKNSPKFLSKVFRRTT